MKKELDDLITDLKQKSGDKLAVKIQDPDKDDGALAKKIASEYGFRPMALGLFSKDAFWFYMVLEGNGRIVQVPMPEDFSKESLKRGIEAALKRFSEGFLKTVALHTPSVPVHGMPMRGSSNRFSWLRDALSNEYTVLSADLKNGMLSEEADLLLLVAPEKLDKKQLFAIDQFLMRGGTIVMATSPYAVNLQGRLAANKNDSGLKQWLTHHGIHIEEELVLDPQNAAFPIPVERRVAGFVVQETRMVEYPYFVDIRTNGMNQKIDMVSGIEQVTLSWASPITIDSDKNKARKVVRLLHSSEQAWTSDMTDIQPDYKTYGQLGFPTGDKTGSNLLAMMVTGRFSSYFKDKPFPLVEQKEERDATPIDNKPKGKKDLERK